MSKDIEKLNIIFLIQRDIICIDLLIKYNILINILNIYHYY